MPLLLATALIAIDYIAQKNARENAGAPPQGEVVPS
jgi:hypothetical protein